MKVDPLNRQSGPGGAKRKRVVSDKGSLVFQRILDSATQPEETEIDRLLQELDESGDALKEHPRLDNFKSYRERVARFIKMFLAQSYDIEMKTELTLTGRQRHIVLVKKIDDRLEEMYHLFMQEILDIEAIFRGVEDVNGMVLDMYR